MHGCSDIYCRLDQHFADQYHKRYSSAILWRRVCISRQLINEQEPVTIARTPKKRSQLVKRQPKRWESPTGKLHRPRTLDGRAKASTRAISDNDTSANEPVNTAVNMATNTAINPAPEPELTPEQEHRRQALKSMLATSNARYQQALRKRGPVFAAGINVKINTPSLYGKIAVVLDADYIESRALLSVPNHDEPIWLPFTDLGLPDVD